jgi:conjugative transposon TraJ protein
MKKKRESAREIVFDCKRTAITRNISRRSLWLKKLSYGPKLRHKSVRCMGPVARRLSWIIILLFAFWVLMPPASHAATAGVGLSGAGGLSGLGGLYGILDGLYDELVPMSTRLIGVARSLAGFAALWYISVRVWRHLAKAEPVDVYPLLRPFAIGLAILFFLPLVNLMNGLLRPVDIATRSMAGDSRKAILLHIKYEEQVGTSPATAAAGLNPVDNASAADMSIYETPDENGESSGIINDSTTFSAGLRSSFSFLNLKYTFKTVMVSLVSMLYEAAALCINTIRTFYLIILTILGPIVLGLSVFDGFRHTLLHWLARYINIYMWLPVANIFGGITTRILEHMLLADQDFLSSTAYVIFMLIAIVGYTTVPSIASYIVQVGGHDGLISRISQASALSAETATGMASAAAGMMGDYMSGGGHRYSHNYSQSAGSASASRHQSGTGGGMPTGNSSSSASGSLPGTGY